EHFAPAFLRLAWPAAAALAALMFARAMYPSTELPPPRRVGEQPLSRPFWWWVAASALLACGFADFALLSYNFQNQAIVAPATIPLLYAGAMAINGVAALLFGRLFDRLGAAALSLGVVVSAASIPLGFLGGTA